MGVLAGEMRAPYCRIVRIDGDRAVFSPGISFPIRPMVGVIATAPAEGEITTALPGETGSNMDQNDVKVGAKVYLPVEVPGALFGLGDLHASMGDGEITSNGIEIGGRTTVRVDLVKGRRWPRPWLENATDWITTASAPTLEEAIKVAVRDMVDLLAERLSVVREDAYVLISARGDVRIGQSCGGLPPTVRVLFPKLVP
ncbi:MAG: acetamidase/formamidase family protein, partial [Chloroflexota bacterium]